MILACLLMSACAGENSDISSSVPEQTTVITTLTTNAAPPPPAQSEGLNVKAQVTHFDENSLTLKYDDREITIDKNTGGNDLYFTSPRFRMLLSDPLGKGHILDVTLSYALTEITNIGFLPENCKGLGKDGYMTFDLVSAGNSRLTGIDENGEKFTAAISSEIMTEDYFSPRYRDKPYTATGIKYPDGDILLVNICPEEIIIPEDEELNNTEYYNYFGTGIVKDVQGDELTLTRLTDNKSITVVPMIHGFNGELKAGDKVFFVPLTGKKYDDDLDKGEICCVVKGSDVSGVLTDFTDNPKLELQSRHSSSSAAIYPEKLTDENKNEITYQQARKLVDKEYYLPFENITCAFLSDEGSDSIYHASSVVIKGKEL